MKTEECRFKCIICELDVYVDIQEIVSGVEICESCRKFLGEDNLSMILQTSGMERNRIIGLFHNERYRSIFRESIFSSMNHKWHIRMDGSHYLWFVNGKDEKLIHSFSEIQEFQVIENGKALSSETSKSMSNKGYFIRNNPGLKETYFSHKEVCQTLTSLEIQLHTISVVRPIESVIITKNKNIDSGSFAYWAIYRYLNILLFKIDWYRLYSNVLDAFVLEAQRDYTKFNELSDDGILNLKQN